MTDKGHERLIEDLKELLKEAENYEFHDFKNTKYATPKVTLHVKLLTIDKKVQNGNYDNES